MESVNRLVIGLATLPSAVLRCAPISGPAAGVEDPDRREATGFIGAADVPATQST